MNAPLKIARKKSRSVSTTGNLLDALRACPEEKVVLELKSSLSPCVIRPVAAAPGMHLI